MGRTLHQLQTNFTSGELDPKLAAREDTKLYGNGMRRLRNMIVQPQGGARRRPGLEYIAAADSQIGSPSGPNGALGGTYTYPAGNSGSGAGAHFLNDGDATPSTSTGNLTSASPFVLVHIDLGASQNIRAADVHSLYISAGTSAEFKVQYSTDNVTFSDFAGTDTVVTGVASRAQYRRFISTGASGYNAARYWRLVLVTNSVDANAALASVGSFWVWSDGGNSVATANKFKLIPFEFNDEQIYMILLDDENAAIYKNGVLLRHAFMPYGSITNLSNVYTAGGETMASLVPLTNWAQSADTLIAVNRAIRPCKLVRSVDYQGQTSETNWVPSPITFSYIPKYNFVSSTTSPATTLTPNKIEGGVTLTAGAAVFTSGMVDDLLIGNGGIVRLTHFTSTTVMKGVTLVPFYDTNAIASGSWTIYGDYSDAWSSGSLNNALIGWPRSVTFHEGRLIFGGSRLRPHTCWGSRVDDFFNMDPGQGFDDDALEFTLDTDQVNAINNVISTRDLQIFTLGGEFYVPQTLGEPMTPATAFGKRQTSRGSKNGLRVIDVDGGSIFVQRGGTAIREYLFGDIEQSYNANNISLLSAHLISDPVDFCLRPATQTDEGDLIICVNDDGTLATCSTLRNQDVTAWTLSEAAGLGSTGVGFLACGALKYGANESYFVVNRELSAGNANYLERFNPDHLLDCSKKATVSGGQATGLTHLRSLTAQAVVTNADGSLTYLGDVSVNGSGVVTGLSSYNGLVVEFGFAFYCEGETMPVAPQLPEGTARSRKKRIVEATFLLQESGSLTVNGNVIDFGGNTAFSGQKVVEGMMEYTQDGTFEFGQDAPLPLNILGVAYQVSV